MEVLWSDFISAFIRKKIRDHGGVRVVGRIYDIDPAIISKVANGKYIPKRSMMVKYFGDEIPQTKEIVIFKKEDINGTRN